MTNYDQLIQSAMVEVDNCKSIENLEKTRIKYFGKNGLVNLELKKISSMSVELKKKNRKKLNKFKIDFFEKLNFKKLNLDRDQINKSIVNKRGLCFVVLYFIVVNIGSLGSKNFSNTVC